MTREDWIKLIVPAIVALVGIILTAVIATYRNRRPKIVYHTTTNTINPSANGRNITIVLTAIIPGGETYFINRIFFVDVEVQNRSSKEFGDFTFGVTFPSDTTIISAEYLPADRFHKMEEVEKDDADTLRYQRDIMITPFNQGDKYRARFIVAPIIPEEGEKGYKDTLGVVANDRVEVGTFAAGPRMVRVIRVEDSDYDFPTNRHLLFGIPTIAILLILSVTIGIFTWIEVIPLMLASCMGALVFYASSPKAFWRR